MKAVLLVGHGSRKMASNDQFIQFANMVGQQCDSALFRYAFLELATPSILDEIKICVEEGAKKITVFPLLLLSAGHAKYDIPNELAKAKQLYPNITFQLENPLGMQETLLSILEQRLVEKQYQRDNNSLIVFVGRGSYEKEAIAEFTMISDHLSQRLRPSNVQCCFLVGGETSFEDAINCAKKSHYERIYVLPYLLFNGILLKKIHQSVNSINDERFNVSEPIGSDKKITKLVSQLVNQAL